MEKAVVFWSGGKDSAMALHKAKKEGILEIFALVTVLNKDTGTSSAHKLSESVIERQALHIGLPLRKIWVNGVVSNTEYEQAILKVYAELQNQGISTVIYGDIFLEDIKTYREELIGKTKLKVQFPLWDIRSDQLMEEFFQSGFKAIICAVNETVLQERYLGRVLDENFISELPVHVDPAGENGEFHTFCFDGPIFKDAVEYKTGVKNFSSSPLKSREPTSVQRFAYIDIL